MMNTLTPFIQHELENLPNETHGRAQDAVPPSWAGTCMPCRQKNARSFLRGETPGTQRTALPELAQTGSCQQDAETVLRLVEWREEAPYG